MARPQHLIESIHYGANGGPSSSICTCGTRLSAATPEALETKWKRHHGPDVRRGWIADE